jgi:hypothetical protein
MTTKSNDPQTVMRRSGNNGRSGNRCAAAKRPNPCHRLLGTYRAPLISEQLFGQEQGLPNGRAARRGRFVFTPFETKGVARSAGGCTPTAESHHPRSRCARKSGRGMPSRTARAIPLSRCARVRCTPPFLRKGEDKHAAPRRSTPFGTKRSCRRRGDALARCEIAALAPCPTGWHAMCCDIW